VRDLLGAAGLKQGRPAHVVLGGGRFLALLGEQSWCASPLVNAYVFSLGKLIALGNRRCFFSWEVDCLGQSLLR